MAIIFESIYSDAIVFVATFIVAVYWWLSSKQSYWSSRGIPGPKPHLLFGNVKDLVLRRTFKGKMYQEIYNSIDGYKFGGMFFLQKPMLLLRDPSLIKAFLVKDFPHFQDRDMKTLRNSKSPVSVNLVSLTGQSWKNLRSMLTPIFTSGKMKAMSNAMVECAHNLTSNMDSLVDSEGDVEVKEMTARYSTDVVGACVFGLQTDAISNPNSTFRKKAKLFTSPSLKNFVSGIILRNLPSFIIRLFQMFNASNSSGTLEYFFKLIEDTVKTREEERMKRNDFLQLLIELRDKIQAEKKSAPNNSNSTENVPKEIISSGRENKIQENDFEFNDKFMAVQCIVFFVAGFETSSTTMSFCLYELAFNPKIQDQLRQEIDAVLQKHDGHLTYDALHEMKYLDCVIDETLRKHPPVGFLGRVCTKPYVIPGTKIEVEKEMVVQVPVYALHYDTKYYPEPDKFDPDRFTQENKNKRPQYTYLPFGDGPRMCIGMRFGLLQVKVGLAELISKYTFSPCSKTQVPLCYEGSTSVTSAKGELWLQVTGREKYNS